MFNESREPFNNPVAQQANAINQYYDTTLPNPVYVQNRNIDINRLTGNLSNDLKTSEAGIDNTRLESGLSSELLATRQAQCEGGGVIDKFQHLTNLVNSQDPQSRARCGWIYNTQNPQNGAGAYGIDNGPYQTSVRGQWMWDLREAKKKVHIDLCKRVQNCQDLDAPMFRDRCGFCKSSGKAVPITNGITAYPNDPNNSCSSAALVKTAGTCPPIPAVDPGSPGSQAIDVCARLPNGALKRDCIIQKARQAGCTEDGSLLQALKVGSDMNYLDALVQAKSYTVYQQRAALPLDETSLKNGRVTISQALTEFQRVNQQASSSVQTGLRASARDLCYASGTVDQFDFCTELLDTSRPPYSLECLQKEFLRAGGQRSGLQFPKATNIATEWNSQSTWKDVKAKIRVLSDATSSTDRGKQQIAMADFLGIPLEDKSKALMPKIPGVEIFWFTHQWDVNTPTVFLGRRIRPTPPDINQSIDLKGTQGRGNNSDLTSFNYFTNILPPNDMNIRVRCTGDDGFANTLNRPITNIWNWKWTTDSQETTWLGYFPPQMIINWWNCWNITSKGPNILQGYWFNGGGGYYYKFEYQQNCSWNWWNNWWAGWSTLPSSMCHLTQEPFAPMICFEVYQNAYRFGSGWAFCDRRMGGNKLKWVLDQTIPEVKYAPSLASAEYPLRKGYVQFAPGRGVRSAFKMKFYSFMTMTLLIRFDSVPAASSNEPNFMYFYSEGRSYLLLYLQGTGVFNKAKLGVWHQRGGRNDKSVGLDVEVGVTYLITLRMLRATESDIFSLNSIQLGVAPLSELQKDGKALKELSPIVFSDPKWLENPHDGFNADIVFGPYFPYKVYWLHFFDYKMDAASIKREANQDWLTGWYT